MSGRRRLVACAGLAVAAAAAATPPGMQLLLSGGAIALMGLPHGASDLAVVPTRRHCSFLVAYLMVVGLTVALWQVAPQVGLLALLALSAVHFALDVPTGTDPPAAWGWGLALVGGPALFHRESLAGLLAPLVGSVSEAARFAGVLQGLGLAAVALVAGRWLQRRTTIEPRSAAGLAALLFLPPLIGFTAGFVLHHAWPQLEERRQELGCADLPAYLRRTAPVLAGAGAVVAGIALAFATHPSAPTAILFAAIAALATPHMLVTPLWRRAPQPMARLARA